MIETTGGTLPAFPSRRSSESVRQELDGHARQIPDWDGEMGVERLGYAMTRPENIAVEVLDRFTEINSNNIGIHADDMYGTGTRKLEYEVVQDLIGLMNGSRQDHAGYITSGGTEGNIYGQWIGRESLGGTYGSPGVPDVLVNGFTHSSNLKAAKLLGMRTVMLPDKDGRFDTDELESYLSSNTWPAIIVASAGYYSTGMVDDIPRIDSLVARSPRTRYAHIDAAIGGYVLPFSKPDLDFDLRNPHVGSITVDPHKNGGMPYACGAVLYRRDAQRSISHYNHLAGVSDETLIGSRPGAAAAALWAVHRTLGYQGYKDNVDSCLAVKERFIDALQGFDKESVIVSNPYMNHFAISFSEGSVDRVQAISDKYRLVANPMTVDGETRTYYHFYIMPHITPATLDRFMTDLQET